MLSRWLDTVGLANSGELVGLLARSGAVRGVLFGHVHQALDRSWQGLRMIATPSTCSQFKPLSDDFAIDNLPPAWRTLSLHEDGRLETELRWVEAQRAQRQA
jgi:Icc protein